MTKALGPPATEWNLCQVGKHVVFNEDSYSSEHLECGRGILPPCLWTTPWPAAMPRGLWLSRDLPPSTPVRPPRGPPGPVSEAMQVGHLQLRRGSLRTQPVGRAGQFYPGRHASITNITDVKAPCRLQIGYCNYHVISDASIGFPGRFPNNIFILSVVPW